MDERQSSHSAEFAIGTALDDLRRSGEAHNILAIEGIACGLRNGFQRLKDSIGRNAMRIEAIPWCANVRKFHRATYSEAVM
jgi:hypothetical protein